jgi:hypothetical protein
MIYYLTPNPFLIGLSCRGTRDLRDLRIEPSRKLSVKISYIDPSQMPRAPA